MLDDTVRTRSVDEGLATSQVLARAAPRSWICRIVAGPDAGRQAILGSRPLLVGAHKSCDLVLRDPSVSGKHAELLVSAGGLSVRDLGSTNGTWWMGSRVTEAVIPPDATLRVGQTTIKLSGGEVPTLPPSERRQFGSLVGCSVAMREVFAVLEKASPADATVLIEGESGTGKELAARAIHDHSNRAKGPFVVVDCSAVSEDLVQSQLFGHRRGAFTGATSDRPGAFVAASGGTLFLDELGELPLTVQAKLLRALEAREVTPVGADGATPVDVRVIAATCRDLSSMVNAKTFRFDLFHRLAVVHVALPPLRDRLEDIPVLVHHFYQGRAKTHAEIEHCDNMGRLQAHAWPGNVRELRNVLERAWTLSESPDDFAALQLWLHPIAPSTTPSSDAVHAHLPFKEAKGHYLAIFERRYLATVLERFAGNLSRAAAHAGINRRHFRALLRKYRLYE